MPIHRAVRRALVPAAASMLAIIAASAPLSAQCFRDADAPPGCLRPSPTDKPGAAIDDALRLHVFVKGTDNALWHRVRMGPDAAASWGAWESLGGSLLSGPSASLRPGTTTIDVFARGASNHLVHRWLSGSTWSAWEDLGGNIDSDPSSVSWNGNRVDVFARNASDQSLGHNYWPATNGNWSGWSSLGGVLAGGPVATSWAPNRLDVMVAGGGSYMYHKSFNGTAWTAEYDQQGCCIIGTPAAFTARVGSMIVAALGTDSRIFSQWYTESGWSGWNTELSQWHAAASPVFAYHAPNTPELIAMIPGGILMRLGTDATGNWGFWQPLMAGQYLTDIAVTSNADYSTAMNGCPAGYAPTGQDLNEGAGGDYIFLCLQWGGINRAIYNVGIQVADSDPTNCPDGYTVGTNDLNKGAGGAFLYVCYTKINTPGQLPLNNIGFRTTTFLAAIAALTGDNPLTCTTGENVLFGASPKNLGNLNLGTKKGKYIIACMIRATS